MQEIAEVHMALLDKDWAFLQAAVPELEDYLLSPVLFWPLALRIGKPIPEDLNRLTLGNLLLTLARLNVYPWDEGQKQTLSALQRQVEATRERWLANWRRKAAQEIPVRLHLWQQYLDECLGNGSGQGRADFAYQVRQRVILHFLLQEVERPDAEHLDVLNMLDSRLRAHLPLNGFLWEAEIAPGFPKEVFWFLYLKP